MTNKTRMLVDETCTGEGFGSFQKYEDSGFGSVGEGLYGVTVQDRAGFGACPRSLLPKASGTHGDRSDSVKGGVY